VTHSSIFLLGYCTADPAEKPQLLAPERQTGVVHVWIVMRMDRMLRCCRYRTRHGILVLQYTSSTVQTTQKADRFANRLRS
jgi:hypothetical protein